MADVYTWAFSGERVDGTNFNLSGDFLNEDIGASDVDNSYVESVPNYGGVRRYVSAVSGQGYVWRVRKECDDYAQRVNVMETWSGAKGATGTVSIDVQNDATATRDDDYTDIFIESVSFSKVGSRAFIAEFAGRHIEA